MGASWVRGFEELGLDDLPSVGEEHASLGELHRALSPLGAEAPAGFVTTVEACAAFLRAESVSGAVDAALADAASGDRARLRAGSRRARTALMDADVPPELAQLVEESYRRLEASHGPGCSVVVRASPVIQHVPQADVPPSREVARDVRGVHDLLEVVHRCYADLFSEQALEERVRRGWQQHQVSVSIRVQHESSDGTAGTLFSFDPESGFEDVVRIGVGQGDDEPLSEHDVFVFKPTLRNGFRPVLRRGRGSEADLTDEEMLTLARWADAVGEHFTRIRGTSTPVKLHWARNRSGDLCVHQVHLADLLASRPSAELERHHLDETGDLLVTGRSVGEKVGQGRARVVRSLEELEQFQPGEVLVTESTSPDWEAKMRHAAAVVVNQGGRASHAEEASRRFGIPAVLGTVRGTELIPPATEITVACAEGKEGKVYRGLLSSHVEHVDVASLSRPRMRILLNVDDPDQAFRLAALPNDGVGMAGLEHILRSSVRVHPLALLQPDLVTDADERAEMERLMAGHVDGSQYFVDRLAGGVGTIAAAFWPKDVVVRFSDFQAKDYQELLGGGAFETREENPLLGFRGAARYTDPRFREAFALECAALRRVRDDMGLRNVKLLLPFCRTPAEAEKVLEELASHGLRRGEQGLEIFLSCAVPSNVILASEFAQLFDGFAIGSDDLMQLVLGVDREAERVAHLMDERHPAIRRVVAQLVRVARDTGRSVAVCGRAPGESADFTKFLVEAGVDSISLDPDVLLPLTLEVVELEQLSMPKRRATDRDRLIAEFLPHD